MSIVLSAMSVYIILTVGYSKTGGEGFKIAYGPFTKDYAENKIKDVNMIALMRQYGSIEISLTITTEPQLKTYPDDLPTGPIQYCTYHEPYESKKAAFDYSAEKTI